MKEENPELVGTCYACGVCYFQCPMRLTSTVEIEKRVFGKKGKKPIGTYRACYAARSTWDEALEVAQDGGVVSTLIEASLQNGSIDYAILSGIDETIPWKPVAKVVSLGGSVLDFAGSKYAPSSMLMGLMSAVEEHKGRETAMVGRPCEIKAVRIMQHTSFGCLRIGGKAKLLIGLFCAESFSHKGFIESYLKKAKGVNLSTVSKMQIAKGKLTVYAGSEKVVEAPLKELKPYALSGCSHCSDFTAELADISVGNVGSPDGWSTVIVRTALGKRVFEETVKTNKLEVKPIEEVEPGLSAVVKLAEWKRKKALKSSTSTSVTHRS
jgi:coenzyme F420 hydrogenase subunit beta